MEKTVKIIIGIWLVLATGYISYSFVINTEIFKQFNYQQGMQEGINQSNKSVSEAVNKLYAECKPLEVMNGETKMIFNPVCKK